MGKWTVLVTVILLVGLMVCAQRITYWRAEADEAIDALYENTYEPESWKNYQGLRIDKANSSITLWMIVAVTWAVVWVVVVLLVHRWEQRKGAEVDPTWPGSMS